MDDFSSFVCRTLSYRSSRRKSYDYCRHQSSVLESSLRSSLHLSRLFNSPRVIHSIHIFIHSVLRDYHALFIFNRIDEVLIVCFSCLFVFIDSMFYGIPPSCSIAMKSIKSHLRTLFGDSSNLLL